MDDTFEETIDRAAQVIAAAELFVITAGAGMGVDSGLPDFRGDHGFWQAYPPYARLGLSFADCANPEHFRRDPAFGWGFYGHRTNLYRSTVPHAGFHLIREWIARKNAPYFVVTSNVDGQFQRAGYDEERILEIHGSIHWLQCSAPCGEHIWPNDEQLTIDESCMRSEQVPRCPKCGGVSRPNILMFGDWNWLARRTAEQEQRLEKFLEDAGDRPMAVIEMGAGTAIPSIRAMSERLGWGREQATVIRINPREPEIRSPHLSLACNALARLRLIDERLRCL